MIGASVRVDVDSLPAAGRSWEIGPTVPWALQAAAEALEGPPSALEGTIRVALRDGGVLEVRLALRAALAASCDRCGEPLELKVDVDQVLRYRPVEPATGDAEPELDVELEADDLDVGWFADGVVELGDALREALALELPPRRSCADTAACDARTEALLSAVSAAPSGHPAFAVLSRLAD